MTQWVEEPRGGRERGPRGLARAWVEVLVRPGRFLRNGVAPGDQAPGLVFAVAVTLGYVGLRFALVPAARPFGGADAGTTTTVLVVAAVGVLVAPAALHLTAALQTLLLMALVPGRAGVSETVQVLAYATAPAGVLALAHLAYLLVDPALAGTVVTWARLLAALWGAGLLVYGLSVVHGASIPRALLAGAAPALFVFGYAFGGLFAAETLLGVELVDTTPPSGRT